MTRIRPAAVAAAVLCAAVPAGAVAAVDGAGTPLKRPRGTYEGSHGVVLSVTGRQIQLAAFDFDCDGARGRTSLNDVAIRKRRGRYRFTVTSFGNVTYDDDAPDENGRITLSGRFSPTGRRAVGTFRVRTTRCGSTGAVAWAARR